QIIAYKILGFGLKQDLVLLMSIFFAVTYLTYYMARKIYNERIARISIVIVASNVLYITFALYGNRPDVLLGVWTLLALLAYFKGLKDSRFFVLAGVFCALSLSSHIVGCLMFASLLIVHLMENKWKLNSSVRKALLLISLGFFIGMIPQAAYAAQDIDLFIEQRWMNTEGNLAESVLSETERLSGMFLHKSMVFVSILFLLGLYYAGHIRKTDKYARIFLFIILFHTVLFIFVTHKSPRYYSSVIPLFTILAAKMLNDLFDRKKLAKIAGCFFVLMFLFGIGNYFASVVLMYHTNNYYSLDQYMEQKYLGEEEGRVVIAQPAFFFMFQDKMYAYKTIFHRMTHGESFESLIAELNPKYVVYDSHMVYYNTRLPDHAFWKFLSEDMVPVETVCFVGNNRVMDEKQYLRRMNHNYFELFKSIIFGGSGMCIDPVTIYKRI
ncbi:MAG: glycosyltransferase family 39 protein, partial [Candidatus Aenigmarchaeota archaeon]|nr:glycosyltransferase family 39 protein [Candidatus Aenigmarchaeota archaeon]